MFTAARRQAWLLPLLLVLLFVGIASSQTFVRVGQPYQINTVVFDQLDGNNAPIPKYDVDFNLIITTGSPAVDADTSVFKLWKPADKTKFYGPRDLFHSPVNSSTLETVLAGTAIPGYSYFILSSLAPDTFSISIYDPNADVTNTFGQIAFYQPILKYYDADGNEITSSTNIEIQTGVPFKVTVIAYKPNGIKDTTFESAGSRQWLRPDLTGDATGLEFYNVDNLGNPLSKQDSINLKKGTATFFISSATPINGDSFDFTYVYSSYLNQYKPIGTSTFPGKLQVSYGDVPLLDSALIFDTDGDGLADKIDGHFNMGVDTLPTKPETNWPSDADFASVSTKTINLQWTTGATKLSVNVDEKDIPMGTVAAGDFRVTVTGESGNKVVTTATLIDRIGPVLQNVTLIPGRNGDPDTLIARFNKDIDSTYEGGQSLLLNGDKLDVTGEKIKERTWRFIVEDPNLTVKNGDKIRLATSGDAVIKSYNGNSPSTNNQEVVVREALTLPPFGAGSGFYDTNGDGLMDSIGVVFEEGLNSLQVDSLDFRFVWKDSQGNPIELKPVASDLIWSATNPEKVGWKVDSTYDLMPFLTSINSLNYGYGNVLTSWEVNGETLVDTIEVPMNDYMAPVLVKATLWPITSGVEKGDSLQLVFSESVDYSNISSLDFIKFQATGESVTDLPISKVQWLDSGRTLSMRVGEKVNLNLRPNPGDSVKIILISNGIQDSLNNSMKLDGQFVQIIGDARVLQNVSFHAGIKDRVNIGKDALKDEKGHLQTIKLDFYPDNATLADVPEGSLGVLLDIGQSTLGNYDSLLNRVDLDLSKIGLEWRLDVFTNLGGFVASKSGALMCNDTAITGYNGNCFENRKQLYISWNLLSESGRKAGYGVYAAKLTLNIRGSKPVKVEKVYLWGLSSKGLKGGL